MVSLLICVHQKYQLHVVKNVKQLY